MGVQSRVRLAPRLSGLVGGIVLVLAALAFLGTWGTPPEPPAPENEVGRAEAPALRSETQVPNLQPAEANEPAGGARVGPSGELFVITGEIHDVRGQPVPRGHVVLVPFLGPLEQGEFRVPVSADASFCCAVPRFRDAFSIRIRFVDDQRIGRTKVISALVDENAAHVVLTARPAATLKVRVVSTSGHAEAGATVAAVEGGHRVGQAIQTDALGECALRVGTGPVTIQAWSGGLFGQANVVVPSSGELTVLELTRPLYPLTVRLEAGPAGYRDGQLAYVAVRGGLEGVVRAVVGGDAMRLNLLRAPRDDVVDLAIGFEDGQRLSPSVRMRPRVEGGPPEVVVTIRHEVTTELVVLSSSGDELPRQRILVRRAPSLTDRNNAPTEYTTGRDGRVTLRGMRPGDYELAVPVLGARRALLKWVGFVVSDVDTLHRVACPNVGMMTIRYTGPRRLRNAPVAVRAQFVSPTQSMEHLVARARAHYDIKGNLKLAFASSSSGLVVELTAGALGDVVARQKARLTKSHDVALEAKVLTANVRIRIRRGEEVRVGGFVWVSSEPSDGRRREVSRTYLAEDTGVAVFQGLRVGPYKVYYGLEPTLAPGPDLLGRIAVEPGGSEFEYDLDAKSAR